MVRWDSMRWAGRETTQPFERYIHLAATRERQIERVPVDEIAFVDSPILDAHVCHPVCQGGERDRAEK